MKLRLKIKNFKKDFDDEYDTEITPGKKYITLEAHRSRITPRVAVPFDRNNSSTRKSTMFLKCVSNMSGGRGNSEANC